MWIVKNTLPVAFCCRLYNLYVDISEFPAIFSTCTKVQQHYLKHITLLPIKQQYILTVNLFEKPGWTSTKNKNSLTPYLYGYYIFNYFPPFNAVHSILLFNLTCSVWQHFLQLHLLIQVLFGLPLALSSPLDNPCSICISGYSTVTQSLSQLTNLLHVNLSVTLITHSHLIILISACKLWHKAIKKTNNDMTWTLDKIIQKHKVAKVQHKFTFLLSLLNKKFDQLGSVCINLYTNTSARHKRKMFPAICKQCSKINCFSNWELKITIVNESVQYQELHFTKLQQIAAMQSSKSTMKHITFPVNLTVCFLTQLSASPFHK